MIAFPDIDPVLLEIGPVAIRWYSLSYVVGILFAWWVALKANKCEPQLIKNQKIDDLVVWVILGIVLGGRLGYVLFYQWEYYVAFPEDILAVWKGGMSFHGALVGCVLAVLLFAKSQKISFWSVSDVCVVGAPFGIMLGRISNFINGELYGRITDVPWGVVFPGDPFTRHPSQLYQAMGEGFMLLCIMLGFAFGTKAKHKVGTLSGIFLCGYSILRSVAELFREPDPQLGFIFGGITMGQLLCVPMLLIGVVLIIRSKTKTVLAS